MKVFSSYLLQNERRKIFHFILNFVSLPPDSKASNNRYPLIIDYFKGFKTRERHFGEMLEWLKRHAWKACIPQKGIRGSNPRLSAEIRYKFRHSKKILFLFLNAFFMPVCFSVFCSIAMLFLLRISTECLPRGGPCERYLYDGFDGDISPPRCMYMPSVQHLYFQPRASI